jgi:hypothetical protein
LNRSRGETADRADTADEQELTTSERRMRRND